MWHASIALLGADGRAVLSAEVARPARRLARVLGERLLAGVGRGTLYEHTKVVAFHFRRQLSANEEDALPQWWRDIKPVDMG